MTYLLLQCFSWPSLHTSKCACEDEVYFFVVGVSVWCISVYRVLNCSFSACKSAKGVNQEYTKNICINFIEAHNTLRLAESNCVMVSLEK